MEKVRIDHLNFSVNDFQTSLEFYNKVFGFELVESGYGTNNAKWGILKSGDSMLAISEQKERVQYEGKRYHKLNHMAFRLQDEEAFAQKVKDYMLRTSYNSPVQYPFSTSWYVFDPSGNSIEVVFWKNDLVRFPENAKTQF
ncbi:MAG: VOC family protein [Bdellovibrionota bacterium]|nr:VOC family protein [Bdellovibrionota bacterium]